MRPPFGGTSHSSSIPTPPNAPAPASPGNVCPRREGPGGPLSNQPASLSDLAAEGWCNPHAYLKMRCLLLPSPLPEVYSAPDP
jgi:hypothetical protein